MCPKAQGDCEEYLVQLGTGWFGFGSTRAGLPQTQLRELSAETSHQMCSCTELGFYRFRFKMQSSAFPPPFTLFVLLFHTQRDIRG